MSDTAIFTVWPGKTDRDSPTTRLPAAWHMLDVAACATCLIDHHAQLRGLCAPQKQALLLLICLHDLGKFSTSFRAMLLDDIPQTYRHWKLSAILLQEMDDELARILKGEKEVRRILGAAVAGHHGGPPNGNELDAKQRCIGDEGRAAARAFIRAVAGLFPNASLEGINEGQAGAMSWILSGLTVQSDWLGSNIRWFPVRREYTRTAEAWADSRARAKKATLDAGLETAVAKSIFSAQPLFDLSSLRPMQTAVESVPLQDGPMMVMIEDATGAGKTEAALILAQRMIADGKADGLFFALPTVATANAIYERVGKVVPKLFETPPSVVLAHSRSALNARFEATIGQPTSRSDALTCSQWLADDRRLTLLAQVGVGTIDQALMAVLPIRFNSLRLWGLTRKIVIVDEAHSYDPYMEAQLARFLQFHAMLGGSAIVMTATLPRVTRQRLVQAFQAGLGVSARAMRKSKPDIKGTAYPALSVVTRQISSQPVAPVPATCRHIAVQRLGDAGAALGLLKTASQKGAACVWVRNAVDDAINAVQVLRAAGVKADLLHARFAMCDRLRIEESVQARFGRKGQGRAGHMLVATQVVEASLDLDFDVMVSDLAPIGALIQRAGRLWRHMDLRPADSRPAKGPVLHVLSPAPDKVENNRWLHQVLGGGAWVYPQDAQWRTAKLLFDEGEIVAPDGLRGLIEAVHGEAGPPLPAPLERAGFDTEGRQMSERALGANSVLYADQPFDQAQNQKVFYDEDFPTRLGAPQVMLMLTRAMDADLVPWANAPKSSHAEALSEVQMSQFRFDKLPAPPDQSLPKVLAFKANWPKWKQDKVVVAVVAEDRKICEGLRYSKDFGLINISCD